MMTRMLTMKSLFHHDHPEYERYGVQKKYQVIASRHCWVNMPENGIYEPIDHQTTGEHSLMREAIKAMHGDPMIQNNYNTSLRGPWKGYSWEARKRYARYMDPIEFLPLDYKVTVKGSVLKNDANTFFEGVTDDPEYNPSLWERPLSVHLQPFGVHNKRQRTAKGEAGQELKSTQRQMRNQQLQDSSSTASSSTWQGSQSHDSSSSTNYGQGNRTQGQTTGRWRPVAQSTDTTVNSSLRDPSPYHIPDDRSNRSRSPSRHRRGESPQWVRRINRGQSSESES